MERSRKEQHQRLRNRRKRKNARSWLLISAAALVCAAGLYAWKGGGLHNDKPAAAAVPSASTGQGSTSSASPKATPSPSVNASPAVSPDPNPKPAASVPAAPVISATSEPFPDERDAVKMAFVGDVIFASTVETVLKQKGYNYPYSDVLSYLQQPDVTVANLETPVTERGSEQKKEYTYRSSPLALPAFKEAGFDVVNLANNHIMDYGTDGLLDTLSHLDKAGIERTGAGKDLDDAYKPAIVERKGLKIAFLGFSRVVPDNSWKAGKDKPGTTQTYDYTLPVETITKAKAEADIVVVMAHWGVERHDSPESYQRTLAKRYIDAGADLIVGTHPHVLQGFEMYKGKWIAYSLGNFLFTTNLRADTWETVILEAACSKDKGCSLSAVPVWNKFAKPTPMGDADGKKLFERLTRISFSAKVGPDGRIQAAGASSKP